MEEESEEKKQESILSRIQSHLYNCFLKTQWQRILWSICFAVLSIIGFYYLEKALLPLIPEKKPKYNYLLELVDLDSLRTLSLLSGIFLYILESDERRKHRQYKAWQDIDHAKSKTSPLRRKRLEELYKDGVSLEGIDLQGADLSEIDLSGAKLERANFCKAKLLKANLSNSLLTSAEFKNANFAMTNFSGARLWFSDFDSANLCGADLTNADLLLAGLSNAQLIGTKLANSNLKGSWLEGANLMSADLSGASLDITNFMNADIRNADLKGVKLVRTPILIGLKGLDTAKNVPNEFIELWKEQNNQEAPDDDNDRPEKNTPQ
jgi:hypothetical protein